MNAHFELSGLHEAVLVITPDDGVEAMLCASFIRFDANLFTVNVERDEKGKIRRFLISAEQSS